HPALRPGCGAAFGVEAGGEERLVVVQEASDRAPLDIDDLAQTVRRKLAEAHDVVLEKLVLIRPRTIPKTSSGKIQRRACRAEYLAGEFEVLAEWQASTSEQPGQVAATQAAGDDSNLDELLAWLRELAGEKIDWYQVDERRTLPPHLVLALGNRGLLGLQAPIADGGLDLGHGALMRVLVQLGAIDLTLATFVVGHNALGLRPVQRYATAELRRRSLPELARGRDLAAFALTEPGAGSHPLAMAAIAEPDGEGWRLRGHKVWSGSAGWAGWINVFARNTDEQGRSHGLIGFVVRPDQPGVRIGAEAATLGLRSMTQNAIHLDGVRVTRQQLLGEPGNGMAVAEDAMLFTRFCLAAVAVGGARRCLQLMLRYASRRTVATGRLLENPVTLHHLRELSAEVEALAALVSATAAALDAGEQVPAEIFAALKIAGPELLWRAVDRAVQLLGGRGYLENNGVARMLRDARVFRIFEGPTETLEMWLGASVLRDAGELDAFLRARLSGAEVADRLRHELERLRESRAELASAGAERLTAQQAVGWRVGAMVVQAALWAASGDRSHAAAAAESRFETAVRQASSLMDEAGSAAVVRSEIAAFSDTIGDIEPMVKPLDLELDALVSRSDGSLPVSHPVPEPVVTPVSLAVGSSARSQEITGWLVDFCSRELGVDAAELEVDRPFASLGLNSVTAVAMADELSERLGLRVDRTVAWQYPSIAELALFLAAGEAPSLPASDPAAVAEPLMEPEEADMLRLLAEVEELSDEQAKALLSPESSGMGAVG
ncbi:MAG: acyl-CoA dehydrogenase family protein, partial [Acidobacteriota bacterium]